MSGHHEGDWWPKGKPEIGDELATDLAAIALDKLINEVTAEVVIDAACREAICRIRRGDTRITYYTVLAAATTAAGLLLDEATT